MVRAMTVLTKERHPKADRLWVYTLRSTIAEPVLQVCANFTNVYDVGDVVAVCQEGHECGDFTIESRKVRGVFSQGMMIGTIDAESGSNVTDACADREF